MPRFHPQFITDGEATRFVVMPFAEWEMVREMLEAAHDLRDLRAAKAEDDEEASLSLEQIRREFALELF